MIRPAPTIVLAIVLLAPLALAEGGIEHAQGKIKQESKKLGKKAGVKSEVLEGGSYGSAGCGLGSLIFEPSEGFTQVFAATTNGLFGTQTFGITSGTSNCDGPPHTVGTVHNFIVANRVALSVDVARGGGETIQSLGALAECRDDAVLGRMLQKNFAQIFPSAQASDRDVSAALMRVMSEHAELACAVFG